MSINSNTFDNAFYKDGGDTADINKVSILCKDQGEIYYECTGCDTLICEYCFENGDDLCLDCLIRDILEDELDVKKYLSHNIHEIDFNKINLEVELIHPIRTKEEKI